jgi:hypothetical protein
MCGVAASAQSTDSLRSSSKAGSPFIVAPSFSLAANPTSVAIGDLKGDGKLDLVTTRQDSGNVTVLLGGGNGNFAAGVEYAAGTRVGNALLGDLNGDGKLDIAVIDFSTGEVDVLFGNGDGTFRKPAVYKAIANPLALVPGNFHGAGRTDLAVASAAGVSILTNDGTAHFVAASPVSLSGRPTSLVASDLRGAGHDDLIVAKQDGTVTTLLGDGTGHFATLSPFAAGSGAVSGIAAGDFNGDGKPDLAIAQSASNTVTVLLGRGDGTFQAGVPYAVGNGPVALVAASLRGNGTPDLVTVNRAANTFSVLLGNGDGTFSSSQDFVAGNSPIAIAAGDFNSDGHADLAIVNFQDSTLSVPLGRGDGSFIAARSYKSGLESKAIAAGDLNGDGRTDLVVANFCGTDAACADKGTATVFLADADGSYRADSTISLGSGPVALALADLNGDNKLDLIAANRDDKTLEILPGNGDGTFGEPVTYTLVANPRALFAGDFNGDGKTDLAIASDCGQNTCSQPGTLDIWLGRGDLRLASSATYAVGYSPVSIAGGDLRSSGHIDLAVANTCGSDSTCKSNGTATLLSGDGTGKFASAGDVAIGSSPSSIAIGNLTGSGLDLAVAQRGSNQIAVLHADGKGGFGAPANYAAGSAPSALAIADFNGDGKQDVAAANFQSSTVSVLFGNGSGSLSPAVNYAVGAGPEGMVAVKSGKTGPSSLVTANGNTGSTPVGTDITALFNPQVQSASTTTLAAPAPAAATVDEQVVLTATVTGGGSTPTGNVVFAIDDGGGNFTALSDCGGAGGLSLTGAGTANCTTQLLPVGSPVNVQAQYLGDTNFSSSASADQPVTVTQAGSLVTLSPTVIPTPVVDQPVTFTATVSVAPPATVASDIIAFTGTVSFTDGSNPITGCTALSLTNNSAAGTASAACTTSSLTAAASPHSINAAYSGDSNYNAAGASTLQPIGVDTPTVGTPSASPASPSVNQQVTLSATATPANGYSVVIPFAGTMSFTSGTTTVCASAPVTPATGAASCQVSSLPGGTDSITATYVAGSDPNYASSSTSPALSLPVGAVNTTTTLTSAPSTSTVDQQVVFTATIAPASGTASVAIAGSVAFKNSGITITGCASSAVSYVTAASAYQATCTTSALNATSGSSPNSITAVYSPTGSSYNGSTSSALTQTVNPANTTTTVTANPSTPTVNNPVVFTATVTIPANAAVAPTGTVAFTDNATTITGCGTEGLTLVSASAGTYTATCNLASLSGGGHTIVATYTGDNNYNGSFGNLNLALGSVATTTTLTTSPASSTVNQAVTLTATVSPAGGAIALAGSVSFTDNGGPVNGCVVNFTASTGIATCATSSLALGSHPIVATYSGDSNYKASSSSTFTQVVSQGSTSLILTTTSAGPSVNQPVTLTATVTANPAGPTQLSGSVTFTDTPQGGTATNICTNVAVSPATGIATCPDSWSAAGSHTITAKYANDSNFSASSNTTSETVGSASTSLALTSSNGSTTVNQSVTFTALITEVPVGTAGLTGSVAFTDTPMGGTATGIAGCSAVIPSATNSSGQATAVCADAALTAVGSPHTITASYGNDKNFGGSTNTYTQTVSKGTTNVAVAITSGTNPSTVGAAVTFTATVAASPSGTVAPSGTVTFTDSLTGLAIPNCSGVALVVSGGNYSASCTTAGATSLSLAPSPNGHVITATYANDPNFGGNSGTFTEYVNPQSTSITLNSSTNNASIVNQTVTFTANIPVSGNQTLKGTVVFQDNGVTIAGCASVTPGATASTNWVAACVDSVLTASTPSHTITASYGGDSNFTVGPGTLTQTVSQAATSVALISSADPSAVYESVTFTATVAPNPSGSIPLAGTVTFNDSVTGKPISAACTGIGLTVSGTATVANCTTSALTLGSHIVTAIYGNDANFSGSSKTVAQTVNPAASAIDLVSSTNPITVNSSVTFTATIPVPATANTVTLTGTLSFTDNGVLIGACKPAVPTQSNPGGPGVESCTDPNLTAGNHTIVASYSGDSNVTVSNGTLTQTVDITPSTTAVATSLSPAFSSTGNTAGFENVVIFTATVTPFTGAVPLSGTVAFTVNGTPIKGCTAVAPSAAAGIATCTTTTAASGFADGSNAIVATYSKDSNYGTSSSSTTEVVEDYSITVGPIPAPPAGATALGILVTQGYTSANDLFNPASPTVTSSSISGYTGAPTLTCLPSVKAGAPSCVLATSSLQITTGGGVEPLDEITIDATSATPGTYTFTVTATDPTTSIVRTYQFPVTVVGVASPLTLISGATSNNTATVTFVLPAGVSLSNLICQQVVGPELTSPTTPSQLSIGCAFNPKSIASAASIQDASVVVTLNTGTTVSMAQPSAHSTLLVAGVFGLPIFGLLGLLGGRKSLRSTLLRTIALILICVAAWQVMGCGGSFHGSGTTNGGQTPPGVYDILVQGTGSDGNTYQAVIKLTVTL